MRKIRLTISTGFVGCYHEEIVEVNDDTDEQEINEMLEDFVNNMISTGWEDITDETNE